MNIRKMEAEKNVVVIGQENVIAMSTEKDIILKSAGKTELNAEGDILQYATETLDLYSTTNIKYISNKQLQIKVENGSLNLNAPNGNINLQAAEEVNIISPHITFANSQANIVVTDEGITMQAATIILEAEQINTCNEVQNN